MGGFNFNFPKSSGGGGASAPNSPVIFGGSVGGGGGQNQYMNYSSMTPMNFSMNTPAPTTQGPINFPPNQPYGGYPYFGGGGSLTPVEGSVGAADKLPGGAGTGPTIDPRMTQMLDQFLGGQLGTGIDPFGMSSYLPSSNTYTGAGQVSAPLNPQLQQLQNFLMTGTGGGAGMDQLFRLAQTGGLSGTGLGQLSQTGGLEGILGQLAQTGGQTGALGQIGQSGGLQGTLGNLFQTGGLGNNPLGNISQTGGLSGSLGSLLSNPLGMFGSLPQTGGLEGMLGQLSQTGGLTGTLGGLAQTGGLTGSLGQMASTGSPISALPEWQAMVNAQKTNIGQNQANLKEQFASMGNLSSSPAANAMALYNAQTSADQNSLLGQLQTQALENAQGRSLQAGEFGVGTQSQLGQFGAGLESALGQFGVGNRMNLGQFGTGLQSQLGQFGVGNQMQTGEFGAGLQAQLGQGGIQNQLASLLPSLQTQLAATQGGVGTQLSADTAALGAQSGAASGLGQLGANLGQFTQGLDQQSIQNLMQEYFMTRMQNNPLNNMIFGLGTTFAPVYTRQGGVGSGLVGSIGSMLGGAGQAAGGMAALLPALAAL